MEITSYLKAGYPTLYIVTQEPERAIASIRPEGWQTLCWDCQEESRNRNPAGVWKMLRIRSLRSSGCL